MKTIPWNSCRFIQNKKLFLRPLLEILLKHVWQQLELKVSARLFWGGFSHFGCPWCYCADWEWWEKSVGLHLCIHAILSQRSADCSLDFMARFVLRIHGLSESCTCNPCMSTNGAQEADLSSVSVEEEKCTFPSYRDGITTNLPPALIKHCASLVYVHQHQTHLSRKTAVSKWCLHFCSDVPTYWYSCSAHHISPASLHRKD